MAAAAPLLLIYAAHMYSLYVRTLSVYLPRQQRLSQSAGLMRVLGVLMAPHS